MVFYYGVLFVALGIALSYLRKRWNDRRYEESLNRAFSAFGARTEPKNTHSFGAELRQFGIRPAERAIEPVSSSSSVRRQTPFNTTNPPPTDPKILSLGWITAFFALALIIFAGFVNLGFVERLFLFFAYAAFTAVAISLIWPPRPYTLRTHHVDLAAPNATICIESEAPEKNLTVDFKARNDAVLKQAFLAYFTTNSAIPDPATIQELAEDAVAGIVHEARIPVFRIYVTNINRKKIEPDGGIIIGR